MLIKNWCLRIGLTLALLPSNAMAIEFVVPGVVHLDPDLLIELGLVQDEANNNVWGNIDYVQGVTTHQTIYQDIGLYLNQLFGDIGYVVFVDVHNDGNVVLLDDEPNNAMFNADALLTVHLLENQEDGLLGPDEPTWSDEDEWPR